MSVRGDRRSRGAVVVDLERHADERGLLRPHVVRRGVRDAGLPAALVQCSVSWNAAPQHAARHALAGRAARRGQAGALHARRDLRRGRRPAARLADVPARWSASSSTRTTAARSTSRAGFAHGFLTLRTRPRSSTRCRRPTCPSAARGVRWDDPAFGIAWPAPPPGGRVINERDAELPGRVIGDRRSVGLLEDRGTCRAPKRPSMNACAPPPSARAAPGRRAARARRRRTPAARRRGAPGRRRSRRRPRWRSCS